MVSDRAAMAIEGLAIVEKFMADLLSWKAKL
jgi:hypothetical protein